MKRKFIRAQTAEAVAGAYRRKEQAEKLIFEYFGELIEELYDETEAADDQFDIDYDKLKLNRCFFFL